MAHVQRAVGLYHGRKHPEDLAVVTHDGEGVHEILEAVVGAETWWNENTEFVSSAL